jgi:hypothetical protein
MIAADDGEAHVEGGVMQLMKRVKMMLDADAALFRHVVKSLIVACSEHRPRMARCACRARQLVLARLPVLQVIAVFAVHGLHFPIRAALVKRWALKEATKPVEASFKTLMTQLVVERGVVHGGERVAVAVMLGAVPIKFIFLRKFVAAEEYHVLQKVCQTLDFRGIVHLAATDSHGGSRYEGVRVRDQKTAQPIAQLDESLRPPIDIGDHGR